MGSNRVTDEKLDRVLARVPPCTLPQQAYGPNSLEWAAEPPVVSVWISWPHQAATRVKGVARGWNDRVVVVRWNTSSGDVEAVVWRNAVRRGT